MSLFGRGEFWESHEALERPWRESRSDFLQGLILVASAWVHVGRGNPRGIVAQLRKAERRLAPYRPAYLGVDVDALLAHAERTRALVAGNPDAPGSAWVGLAPAPALGLAAARVRGDEPELDRGGGSDAAESTSTRTHAAMITVANRIFVDPAFAEQFEERFRNRAGLVDRMPGFVSNQVLRPANPGDPYVVLTWWESREAFRAWTESDEFRQGHARSGTLPKEAFTGPNRLEVHEVFQDSSRPDLEPEPPGGPMKFH